VLKKTGFKTGTGEILKNTQKNRIKTPYRQKIAWEIAKTPC
jgi:hypothetical protein